MRNVKVAKMSNNETDRNFTGKHPFLNGEVVIDLLNSVTNTFQNFAGVRSHFDDIAFAQTDWKPCNDLTVSIDIKNDTHSGQIRFHFNREALAEIIQKIFNEVKAPDSTEIKDCLGEISNICSGYAKTKLNEKGFNLKTTLPSAVSNTSDLPQEASGPSIIIPFKILNQECQMQIVVFK